MKTLENSWGEVFNEGQDKVHFIADFDGTLTQEFYHGKKRPSIISILRDEPGYLSKDYQAKAHQLFEYYHRFENDPSLPLAHRKAEMEKWWKAHYQLLAASGLNQSHLLKLAKNGIIELRPGAKDLLQKLSSLGVPVIIMSASGLGEVIKMYMQEQGIDAPNIHYAVNQFEWHEDGSVKAQKGHVIHSLNKDETGLTLFPEIISAVQGRTNMVLLGNSLGDSHMSDGFAYQKIIKIAFLDSIEPKHDQLFDQFNRVYDYVLDEDGYQKLNKLIQ